MLLFTEAAALDANKKRARNPAVTAIERIVTCMIDSSNRLMSGKLLFRYLSNAFGCNGLQKSLAKYFRQIYASQTLAGNLAAPQSQTAAVFNDHHS